MSARRRARACFGFHPSVVERAIPAVWDLIEPAEAAAARTSGADATLRDVLGDAVAGPEVAEAADLARRATEARPSPPAA